MRRIVMFNNVTADGFFAGIDGSLDWAVPDPAVDRDAMSSGGNFDTVLFGRRTYELFASFWSTAVQKGEASPHTGRQMSPEVVAMANFLNSVNKIVFSKSLRSADWQNSQVMREIEPKEIASLKSRPGGNMILFGSGTVVTKLTEYRLIDEYQFIINPVFIGAGQSLMKGLPAKMGLKLLGSKGYPKGSVMLRYAPSKV